MIDPSPTETAVRDHANTLFVSLELSKARWMLTVSAPGAEKISRHAVNGGDGDALLELIARLQASAAKRRGAPVPVAVIQGRRRQQSASRWLRLALAAGEMPDSGRSFKVDEPG